MLFGNQEQLPKKKWTLSYFEILQILSRGVSHDDIHVKKSLEIGFLSLL